MTQNQTSSYPYIHMDLLSNQYNGPKLVPGPPLQNCVSFDPPPSPPTAVLPCGHRFCPTWSLIFQTPIKSVFSIICLYILEIDTIPNTYGVCPPPCSRRVYGGGMIPPPYQYWPFMPPLLHPRHFLTVAASVEGGGIYCAPSQTTRILKEKSSDILLFVLSIFLSFENFSCLSEAPLQFFYMCVF